MDKSYDDLVMRLQAGHDSQCAMSYGMHEHCCDCSYVDRQDAADAIVALQARVAELERSAVSNDTYTREIARTQRAEAECDRLQADLAAVRAESDLAHWLLRNARKYMNPMHEALCAAIDNALQKKQAALAGEKK